MMENVTKIPVAAPTEPLRIVFMGTPEFAAASLGALADFAAGTDARIVGVFTREDKPAGRGHKLTPPPVKVLAEKMGIPVCQPRTLRTPEAFEELRSFGANLIVVAAYGRILPAEVLELPKYGCINVHGSLLPEYRGAAPMQRAIIEGKPFTGITTMYMNEGIDTGDMLETCRVEIGAEDDFGTVHDRMAEAGGKLLVSTLRSLCAGTLVRTPQPEEGATYAAKIEKADCRVDFTRPAAVIHDLIRGCSPAPLAWTHTPDGKLLKITASRVADGGTPAGEAGTVVALDAHGEGGITVACGEGTIVLTRIVPEGKGKMSAAEFIRGRKISIGARLV